MVNKILELQSAVGSNAKQAILNKYSDDEPFCKFLYFALNPMLTYNLSEKTLTNMNKVALDNCDLLYQDIFECCECLASMKGISDEVVRQVKVFLYKYCTKEERDLYIKLLSKTLRLGVTAKTVNKIIPNLIPEWEVQQSYSIEKHPLKSNTEFWLTQKLNGVRATFYKGKLIARSGVPFKGLDHIIREISWVDVAGFVLDGELTLKDKGNLSDNEAFRVATGILNSDNEDKTAICYTIFDAIPINDFENSTPVVNYSVRRVILNELYKSLNESTTVNILPILYNGTDQSKISEYLELMISQDKEGLMLNTDVPYKRKRHSGILKIKRFYTMDLPIIRCEEGSGRLQGTLGAFVLDYKGNEVKVGSGFSDEQRAEYWNAKDDLLGALCEVKYKEISSDKNTGLKSLQFPVFVQIRDDKSEISYC